MASVIILALIDGYIFISMIFLITKLFASELLINPLNYLLFFIFSSILAVLYLLKSKILLKDNYFIFYRKQIFISYYKVKIHLKDIDLIKVSFHKDQFSDLNFIMIRANKKRYRIPTRSYNEELVIKFIEKVKMSKVL